MGIEVNRLANLGFRDRENSSGAVPGTIGERLAAHRNPLDPPQPQQPATLSQGSGNQDLGWTEAEPRNFLGGEFLPWPGVNDGESPTFVPLHGSGTPTTEGTEGEGDEYVLPDSDSTRVTGQLPVPERDHSLVDQQQKSIETAISEGEPVQLPLSDGTTTEVTIDVDEGEDETKSNLMMEHP